MEDKDNTDKCDKKNNPQTPDVYWALAKIGDLVRKVHGDNKGEVGIILKEGCLPYPSWFIQLFDDDYEIIEWHEFDFEVLSGN
jgi:hypothetical protein